MLDIVQPPIEVKGPDGYAFFVAILLLLIIPVVFILIRFLRKDKKGFRNFFGGKSKISLTLIKDRKYYPDFIRVKIKNTGSKDIDIAQPLLVFRNFWTRRKFRLKGTSRYSFYPLLLEPGREHDLTIDLNHFYRHDRRLKRYPQITVVISDVTGRTFPSRSIMLRKTLFR